MPAALNLLGAAFVAFSLGSIPSGLWMGRAVRGIDIRERGSGNLGATNAYRVLGPVWGILVLLLDAVKGALAVILARLAAGESRLAGWLDVAALVSVLAGHMYSPFARFRGGKGVASAAGAWAALAPLPLLAALASWGFVFAVGRIVSVASLVAAGALLAALTWHLRPSPWQHPVFWAGALTAAAILFTHRGNLARLARGEERPLIPKRRSDAS